MTSKKEKEREIHGGGWGQGSLIVSGVNTRTFEDYYINAMRQVLP